MTELQTNPPELQSEFQSVTPDREAWLTELASAIEDEILAPLCPEKLPLNVRFSMGFPKGRKQPKTTTVAQCFVSEISSAGINEIFVSPTIDDSNEIAHAILHECIHAADNCQSGHRHFFARVARQAGLEGKLTATRPGAILGSKLAAMVDLLGPIPHARLNLDQIPTQTTRMQKLMCDQPHCGWQVRISQKQFNAMQYFDCLSCDDGTLKLV